MFAIWSFVCSSATLQKGSNLELAENCNKDSDLNHLMFRLDADTCNSAYWVVAAV